MSPDSATKQRQSLLDLIEAGAGPEDFRETHWTGTFEEYLEIVAREPKVLRNAFQRVYDMILSYGYEERTRQKQKLTHYHFFDDPVDQGADAIFGLDKALARLVGCFKSAAHHYGTEKRVLLLHGPVGSSKSTIARLLKKGLERYSRTPEGALYTFQWQVPELLGDAWVDCPMHEEPLRLVAEDSRQKIVERVTTSHPIEYPLDAAGGLCPFCRFVARELRARYHGDWRQLMGHVRCRRLVLSEADRVGIGTFQPKDEKNQDSTELTGDINYRKIAEYGTDSDPRAFNFDGEFNIANRGIIEFIEVLKLDVAFLYDLLGASQEHHIKPKKFAQTEIDEVILGHSVAGETPIAFRHDGVPGWTTLAGLYDRFAGREHGLEVLAWSRQDDGVRWTPVRRVLRHPFHGEVMRTVQSGGVVETTPNHSIYDVDGRTFFPEEKRELKVARSLDPRLFDAPGAALNLESLREEFESLVRPLGDLGTHGGTTLAVCFRTKSAVEAARVATMASLLGHDYAVVAEDDFRPGYNIEIGAHASDRVTRERFLFSRPAAGAMVYDIECEGLHNFVCGVGNVVCHNTNEPEYRKLQSNELMEAFRDRTIKIDIPYNTVLADEIKIYQKDYNARQIKGKHIAPHTIEVAAMWAVLSRLEDPKNAQLTLLQKLKLYNGKTLPGFTEDNIRELRDAAKREGMNGISPRYVQDKISNALVSDHGVKCINPFMVMNELDDGLRHHSLITNDEQRKRYRDLLGVVRQEYEDIVKNEVQRAISADKQAIQRLCANYVDNIKAYTQREKVRNPYTGQDEEPDERLMRSIEEKIDIAENRKDDFRREIMNYIGALAIEGRTFDYTTNERLQKALELKLFEDQKDSIKLTSLVSKVVDRETQEKIDIVRSRLTKDYGYCDVCAGDVLQFVAGIFARGDTKE